MPALRAGYKYCIPTPRPKVQHSTGTFSVVYPFSQGEEAPEDERNMDISVAWDPEVAAEGKMEDDDTSEGQRKIEMVMVVHRFPSGRIFHAESCPLE